MIENLNLGEKTDEATVIDLLRRSGDRVEILKTQIATLQIEYAAEVETITNLYRQYQGILEPITILAGSLMEANPQPKKKDKRKQNNPIKNLNIGVRRSYEWKENENIPPEKAKKLVYASILKTAIKKGVHAKSCACGGETEGCPVKGTPAVVKVAVKADLPKKVVAKIEKVHLEYIQEYEARIAIEALSATVVQPDQVMIAT
jgi:hypothetical protein